MLLVTLPILLGLELLALATGSLRNAALGVVLWLAFGWLVAAVYRYERRRKPPTARSPWEPPAGREWQARESRVRPRALVGAVNEKDFTMYLLLQIPGREWFCIDVELSPDGHGELADLARAEVRFVALHPDGPISFVHAEGEAIPWLGAKIGTDTPERRIEQRFVWDPDDAWFSGPAEARVPETALPAWMRTLDDTPQR